MRAVSKHVRQKSTIALLAKAKGREEVSLVAISSR
jgi:hypothetical protein